MLSSLENQARVYLAQNRLGECAELVAKCDDFTRRLRTGQYVHRHSTLLKAQLLARLGRWTECIECIDSLAPMTKNASDEYLRSIAALLSAEASLHLGRTADSWKLLESVTPHLARQPPDVLALYERTVSCVLVSSGDVASGRHHHDRARRVLVGIQNVPGVAELTWAWETSRALINNEDMREGRSFTR